MIADADDPLIGTAIGRYEIARRIATGGMGQVYLGVQPAIGSRVAIKVLSARCAQDPDLVERFFAEARAVNLIAHENIVNILDLDTLADGRPYIVMEYVDGITLTRATRGGRAPLGGVVQVITEVLAAIGAAHAIGIVHRDLKPDNILVTAKGHAKVVDFGIAKLTDVLFSPSARTVTGALLGTPAYMAPEQVNGARDVTVLADVYAAGAVLFHAVTGRPPFEGASVFDVMRAHLEDRVPSPRSFRPDLPVAIEQVILRALAKQPHERFASAAEMAAALDAAAAAIPEDAWFDLSPASAPLRVRGSGPRRSVPARNRRETPPAMSAVNMAVVEPRPRWRWPLLVGAGVVLAGVAGFVAASRMRGHAAPSGTPALLTEVASTPHPHDVVPAPSDAAPTPRADDVTPSSLSTPRPATPRPPRTIAKPPAVLRVDNTYALAQSAARTRSGAATATLVSITFGGGNATAGFSTRRGAWVKYRFRIDPPLDDGCHVEVAIGTTVTATPRKGSCSDEPQPYPKCRDFREIWRRVQEKNPRANFAAITYGVDRAGWMPTTKDPAVDDNCGS